MADTASRTLRLLGLMQHHRFWPGEELADRLEVSPRTLRRDIDRLRQLGYPVRSTPGIDGGYQLEPGATMPPLLLDNDEAIALVVGLQGSANAAVSDVAEASLRALGKVMQILPHEVRREVDAVHSMTIASPYSASGPAVTSHVLATVAQACRDEVRLRFGYTAKDGEATDRSIEPYRIVNIGRRFYLVAFDMDRLDWRTFRLDRITEPIPARNRFDPRPLPSADLADYVRTRIEKHAGTYEVVVLIAAPIESVRPRIGRWGELESDGDDSCRLTLTTDALDWPAFALASIAAPFKIVQPPELVDLIRSWVERLDSSTRLSAD